MITMRKILYLLSKGPDRFSSDLLPPSLSHDSSIVLIQDAVHLRNLPFSHVYTLSEDVASRRVTSSFPSISYQQLLDMIFEANTVVAV